MLVLDYYITILLYYKKKSNQNDLKLSHEEILKYQVAIDAWRGLDLDCMASIGQLILERGEI